MQNDQYTAADWKKVTKYGRIKCYVRQYQCEGSTRAQPKGCEY